MKTNKMLRADAVTVFRRRWKPLLGVMIFMALVPEAIAFIAGAMAGESVTMLRLSRVLLTILAYPLCTVGVRYVFLMAWSERKLHVMAVFRYYATARRVFGALLLGAMTEGIRGALVLLSSLYSEYTSTGLAGLFIALPLLFLAAWALMRLALVDCMFIVMEKANVFVVIKEAWYRMWQEVGELSRLYGWYILIILLFAVPALLLGLMRWAIVSTVAVVLEMPFRVYFNVLLAGFAIDRIPELVRLLDGNGPEGMQVRPEDEALRA